MTVDFSNPKSLARLKHGDDQCLNPQNEIPKHRHHLLGTQTPTPKTTTKPTFSFTIPEKITDVKPSKSQTQKYRIRSTPVLETVILKSWIPPTTKNI
jgi:hypothetical protein